MGEGAIVDVTLIGENCQGRRGLGCGSGGQHRRRRITPPTLRATSPTRAWMTGIGCFKRGWPGVRIFLDFQVFRVLVTAEKRAVGIRPYGFAFKCKY